MKHNDYTLKLVKEVFTAVQLYRAVMMPIPDDSIAGIVEKSTHNPYYSGYEKILDGAEACIRILRERYKPQDIDEALGIVDQLVPPGKLRNALEVKAEDLQLEVIGRIRTAVEKKDGGNGYEVLRGLLAHRC